ncbi:hypothetical protein HYS54_04965 [Candidatus Micrarchaeota archaeon]|nr:hypothetical protein [Candidatus Micrarchaeota archaeon]
MLVDSDSIHIPFALQHYRMPAAGVEASTVATQPISPTTAHQQTVHLGSTEATARQDGYSDTRPATTTFFGDTGLWFVPTDDQMASATRSPAHGGYLALPAGEYFPTLYGLNTPSLKLQGERIQDQSVSLEELISKAYYIFVGYARNVYHAMVLQSPDETSVQVRTVTFTLKHVLKGEGLAENTETIKQFAAVTPVIKKDERLLLYLLKPTENKRFQHTVGGYAGHFFILPDPANSGYDVAVNLYNNRGLWSNKGPLWSDDVFPRAAAAEYLAQPHLRLSVERQRQILERGNQPCRPVPVPLELLLAATHANLSASVVR